MTHKVRVNLDRANTGRIYVDDVEVPVRRLTITAGVGEPTIVSLELVAVELEGEFERVEMETVA